MSTQSASFSILPSEDTSIEVIPVDVEADIPTLGITFHQYSGSLLEGTREFTGMSYFTIHLDDLAVEALLDLTIGLHKAATEITKLAEAKYKAPIHETDEGGYDRLEELTE
jgi:hypothetical protein